MVIKKLILFLLLSFSIFSINADNNGVWHYAKDIRGGIFAQDEDNKDFSFPGLVTFNNNAYFMANVGIGTTNPSSKLDVVGNINISSIYDRENNAYFVDPSANSVLNRLYSREIIDLDNPTYHINPSDNTVLNTLKINGNPVDGSYAFNRNYGDSRYVNEGQANSVTAGMIVDGVIGSADINQNQIQRRVTGACSSGYSIRSINSDGSVVCEYDDNADGDTSSSNEIQTISISGHTITLNRGGGSVTVPDNVNDADYIIGNEYPVAGTGISVSGRTVNVDTNTIATKSYVDSKVSSFGGSSCTVYDQWGGSSIVPHARVFHQSCNVGHIGTGYVYQCWNGNIITISSDCQYDSP